MNMMPIPYPRQNPVSSSITRRKQLVLLLANTFLLSLLAAALVEYTYGSIEGENNKEFGQNTSIRGIDRRLQDIQNSSIADDNNVTSSSVPSMSPTNEPTVRPSTSPTAFPSNIPTAIPSDIPTTISPTSFPSDAPSSRPSPSWWQSAFSSKNQHNRKRPSLLNINMSLPVSFRGHQSTVDGRLFIGLLRGDVGRNWGAKVFRPEAITYDDESGKPNFQYTFSQGKTVPLYHKENGLAFCYEDSSRPYKMMDGMAVYQNYIVDDSIRLGNETDSDRTTLLGIRRMEVRVSQPFTEQAEVFSFSVTEKSLLTTVEGKHILAIEPTMTADGRLLVFNGRDFDRKQALFYSYNSNPCSVTGWSIPRPLSWMYRDPNPDLERYPISWSPLRAPDGMEYSITDDPLEEPLLSGAYPWIDHEGRNVLYISVGKKEAVSLVGVETKYIEYDIDGAINGDRRDRPHDFYSGPMWQFERERLPTMRFPLGGRMMSNDDSYLPVTKSHDVMPLFGSVTGDYNEIDLAELKDSSHLLFLPMNEMVTNRHANRKPEYDFTRTPDLSGNFFTGHLVGTAEISEKLELTQALGNNLWLPHGKGKAVVLPKGGAVDVYLKDDNNVLPGIGKPLSSFTVEFALKPDEAVNKNCGVDGLCYLVKKDDEMRITYDAFNQLEFSVKVNGERISLGKSPAIPVGEWSHIAYSWDGASGKFQEYINGIPTYRPNLPVVQGMVQLGEGILVLGDPNINRRLVGDDDDDDFVGEDNDDNIDIDYLVMEDNTVCMEDRTKTFTNSRGDIMSCRWLSRRPEQLRIDLECAYAAYDICPITCGSCGSGQSAAQAPPTVPKQYKDITPPDPGTEKDSARFTIDEFRIYTKVRSARSICHSAYGSDCEEEAMEAVKHTLARPFSMTAEAPACSNANELNSISCQSAMHRGCAERGVSDALSSTVNLYDTVRQLVSNRPPVSLAGVPVASTPDEVTVACAPIRHISVAVEFDLLVRHHPECTHERAMMTTSCISAVNSFCKNQGFTTGITFEVTSRPWVSCFDSALRQTVPIQELGPITSIGDVTSPLSRLEASQWCREQGYGAGLIQHVNITSGTVDVHCFRPSATVVWPYQASVIYT